MILRRLPRSIHYCLATVLAALAALSVTGFYNDADSAQGDCGQPTSLGARPTASDALFILRAAVGAAGCELRTCDVDSSCTLSASDALRTLRASVGQAVTLDCRGSCGGSTTTTTSVTGTTFFITTTTLFGTTTTTLPGNTTTTVLGSTTTSMPGSTTSTTVPFFPATWKEIYDRVIAQHQCGTAGCHSSIVTGSEALFDGLDGPETAYGILVGVPSTQLPSMQRVDSFQPDLSYLIHKLEGTHTGVGGSGLQMPVLGNKVPQESINVIRAWIAAGALNN